MRDRWRENPGPGSGVWADLGPHLVDQALCLFGLPSRVIASLGALRDGARTDDWAHVVLEYPDLRCVLHAGMLVAGGSPRFVVHGSAGSLIKHGLDPQEFQLLEGLRPGAPDWGREPSPLTRYDAEGTAHPLTVQPGDYPAYYAGIAAALDGAPLAVTLEQSLAVMAVVEAATESARTGMAQTVPPIRL